MKKKFLLFAAILLSGTMLVNAQGQGGGFQRRPIEERVKTVMEKLEPFKLDTDKKTQVDSIFTQLYRAQDVKMDAMRASGTFDREAMRADREKTNAERDEKLKKIFTDEQFKEWKDTIEPSLRPQRPAGNGGGNGGGNGNN